AVSEVNILTDNQILGALTPPLAAVAGQLPAGFGENADNKYVYSLVSHDYGNVVAFRAKLPTTPKTYAGENTMGGGQLRFWSMCTGNLATQAYDCRVDKDMPLDADGMYTVAVSTAADRPANATEACGIAWLPWGPLVQAGVIMRNMLPDPGFPNPVQAATPGTEQQTLGAYYPVGTYYASAQEFEQKVGCHAPAVPADSGGAAGAADPASGGGAAEFRPAAETGGTGRPAAGRPRPRPAASAPSRSAWPARPADGRAPAREAAAGCCASRGAGRGSRPPRPTTRPPAAAPWRGRRRCTARHR